MENPEEVLHSLDEFAKLKPKDIPNELEEYLLYVASTGDPVYQWSLIKCLFRQKLINVVTEFYESSPVMDIPPCPNVEPFNYEAMKNGLLERFDSFNSAPFTIQRVSELLTTPRKQYNRVDKFMRAVEKNIWVVSTREPGRRESVTIPDTTMVNGVAPQVLASRPKKGKSIEERIKSGHPQLIDDDDEDEEIDEQMDSTENIDIDAQTAEEDVKEAVSVTDLIDKYESRNMNGEETETTNEQDANYDTPADNTAKESDEKLVVNENDKECVEESGGEVDKQTEISDKSEVKDEEGSQDNTSLISENNLNAENILNDSENGTTEYKNYEEDATYNDKEAVPENFDVRSKEYFSEDKVGNEKDEDEAGESNENSNEVAVSVTEILESESANSVSVEVSQPILEEPDSEESTSVSAEECEEKKDTFIVPTANTEQEEEEEKDCESVGLVLESEDKEDESNEKQEFEYDISKSEFDDFKSENDEISQQTNEQILKNIETLMPDDEEEVEEKKKEISSVLSDSDEVKKEEVELSKISTTLAEDNFSIALPIENNDKVISQYTEVPEISSVVVSDKIIDSFDTKMDENGTGEEKLTEMIVEDSENTEMEVDDTSATSPMVQEDLVEPMDDSDPTQS